MPHHRSRKKSLFRKLRRWWSGSGDSESTRIRRSGPIASFFEFPGKLWRSLTYNLQRFLNSGRRPRKPVSSTRSSRNSFLGNLFSLPYRTIRWMNIFILRFIFAKKRSTLTVTQAAAKGEFKKLKPTHFLNPINWFMWPLGFLFSYFLSRPYMSVGPALLAIAVVLGIIALVAQKRGSGPASRMQTYQQILASNLQNKKLDAALICVKTLIDLAPNDNRFRFERAKIEHELQHKDLANELMLRLASNDRYGPAAIWLAEEKFKLEDVSKWTEQDHKLFRGLLAIALSSPESFSVNAAKLKMASYLTQLNAYSDALNYLDDLTTKNPQFALTAAELAVKVQDNVRLQSLLPLALDYQRAAFTKDPANVQLRMQLARVLIIDDEIDEALKLLSDGVEISKDEVLVNAIGETYVLKAGKIAQKPQTTDTIIQRMQLVHQAATLAPNSPLVIEALIDLILDFRNNTNQEIAILREATLQGLNPECVHFVRGTIALLDDDIAAAKTHLELASKSGIKLPGLLNNLAVTIASHENGDLNQALNLSNSALDQLQHPYLFETRGQILFKMERYQDAILDLERGLQAKELAPMIYPKLVAAYRKLNNEDLADEYEMRLEEINKVQASGESAPANKSQPPNTKPASPNSPDSSAIPRKKNSDLLFEITMGPTNSLICH
jgi:tetratricopeptide (TPR) repeat protein